MSCISFLNTCPASGDTEQQLLSKILQVINTTGGGIAGVSSLSVNGGAPQTGAVSITTGGTVTSVNGDPGPVVSLDSGEIPEGANLYFTETRVRATVLTGFASALGAITAADSVLSAFGKAQGRLAALEAGTAGPFLLRAGDTGTGAFLFTPSADNVIPLTLTTTAGSATTSSNLVVNHGATNRLTLRNDGRFILSGRILATNTDVLGHALNFSDAGTNNAPLALALAHTSTAGLGTAAAGFGAMLDWNLDSTTTLATRAVRETAAWTVATHATRTASLTFFAFTGGSETIQLTLTNNQVQGGDGTVALPVFTTRNAVATGFYFPTATSIATTISGVEQTRLTTTGLGIGASAPLTKLDVRGSGTFGRTSLLYASHGVDALILANPTADVQAIVGVAGEVDTTNSNPAFTSFQPIGISGMVRYRGTTSESTSGKGPRSVDASMFVFNTGTTQHASGFRLDSRNLGTGTITNLYGAWIPGFLNSGGGTITNAYGIKIDAQAVATNTFGVHSSLAAAATTWNVYAPGTAQNHFAGKVGIGATSITPVANLDIQNSTTTTLAYIYHTADNTGTPSNYSRIALSHTAAGAGNQKANFAAETGGTGADNIDVRLIPAGTGGVFLDAGVPLVFASGTNTRAGNATLVGGTVTVANTTVSATTIVMLARKTSGGTIGTAITYTLSAGVSFTITSDSVLDTSTFSYILIGNHAA